jgi:undecaprenyl-diphosphatase
VLWLLLHAVLPRLWRPLEPRLLRAATAVIHASGRRLRRDDPLANAQFYAPVVLIVAAGLIVAFFAGRQFLELAELLRGQSEALQQVDRSVYDWARARRSDGGTLFFLTFTKIGGGWGLSVLVLLVSAALLARRLPYRALYLLVTGLGAAFLNTALKAHYARARPDLTLALSWAEGYSFPSGHSLGSTIVFGALAYVGIRNLRSWWARSGAVALCLTTALAVGLSRVYLGVHWISDVAAGLAGGIVWLSATTVAFEALRRVRTIRRRS